MSLCLKCHGHLHDLRGFFSGYTTGELREWQDARVLETRAAYEAERARKGEAIPGPESKALAPIPGDADVFEPVSAAAEFCSAFELSPQIEHDLLRLLRRALKAAREGKAA